MKKYQLTKTVIRMENKQITSYGIKCNSKTIQDISINKAYVEGIINALNKNNVSEIHLSEIVEDFLILGEAENIAKKDASR